MAGAHEKLYKVDIEADIASMLGHENSDHHRPTTGKANPMGTEKELEQVQTYKKGLRELRQSMNQRPAPTEDAPEEEEEETEDGKKKRKPKAKPKG